MLKCSLAELINVDALQKMSDSLYQVTGIPIGILDTEENIIVAAGWQDICVKLHRAHPETALPVTVDGVHLLTVYIGQFFYDDEEIDYAFYREQAERLGFDETEYLDALHKVPVFSREKIKSIMEYYKSFVLTLVESSTAKQLYTDTYNKLSKLFHAMRDYVLVLDEAGTFVEWNKSMAKEQSSISQNIIGKNYAEVLPRPQARLLASAIRKLENGQTVVPFDFSFPLNDEKRWFSTQISKVNDSLSGETDCYLLVLRDITERKRAEDQVLYLSYRDKLTGMYNRRYFEEKMKKIDTQANLPISVIITDINGLKIINDAFGHETGDEFIRKAACAIRNACREEDFVARWGGDEFVVLLPKTQKSEAEKIVQRIRTLYANESVNSISVSVSVGWDTKTEEDDDIMNVLRSAEDALYKNKIVENPDMRGNAINTIIRALNEKSPREEQHAKRVSEICQKLGMAIGLSDNEVNKLRIVGLLHDIGKIGIPDEILNKPGSLMASEWDEIRRHPDVGYRILNASREMADLAECTWAHHERWDGKGYPKGIKGEEIPVLARIITIADSYDAMTSERPYRKALSREAVTEEIEKNAGVQFDPDIAAIFLQQLSYGSYQ